MKNIIIVPGRNSIELAEKIAKICGYTFAEIEWKVFSDGEYRPKYQNNIRGATLYIINSTNPPIDNLYDVILLIDAAKIASAEKIIFVNPYFGGCRQERKDEARVPITAKVNANIISNLGIKKIITMDLHADAIQGFFEIPIDHLYASHLFVQHIKQEKKSNMIFVSPDVGGSKRVTKYADYFGVEFAICEKTRSVKANQIDRMKLIGNVKNKDVIILDDIADTCGTLQKCTDILWKEKAKSITVYITHPILSGNAIEKIKAMSKVNFVFTDTLKIKHDISQIHNITIISTADMFAEVIRRDVNNESISSLFVFGV